MRIKKKSETYTAEIQFEEHKQRRDIDKKAREYEERKQCIQTLKIKNTREKKVLNVKNNERYTAEIRCEKYIMDNRYIRKRGNQMSGNNTFRLARLRTGGKTV